MKKISYTLTTLLNLSLATLLTLLIFIALARTSYDNKEKIDKEMTNNHSDDKVPSLLEEQSFLLDTICIDQLELSKIKKFLAIDAINDKYLITTEDGLFLVDSCLSNIHVSNFIVSKEDKYSFFYIIDLLILIVLLFILWVCILLWRGDRVELIKKRKWYDAYKKKKFELLNKEDISLLFTEEEINRILAEIEELEVGLEQKTTNYEVNELTSIIEELEKKYIKRKDFRITTVENLKREYQFYIETEECSFNELISNKINNLATINTIDEFNEEIYNISCLIAEDTKKILPEEVKIIDRNINALKEKWKTFKPNKDSRKELEVQEENMRELLNDFYKKHIKRLIHDEKDENQLNAIYHARLIMHLINRRDSKFISSLYMNIDETKRSESWHGNVRNKICNYEKKLRAKLEKSKYPNLYVIFTIRKAL